MAETRDIHDLINAGAVAKPPLQLGQEEKAALGDAATQFTVTDMIYGDDPENGAFFQIKIDLGGQEATFRLYLNGDRDAFLQSVSEAVAAGPVSGLRLHTYRGGKGNPRVELEPA